MMVTNAYHNLITYYWKIYLSSVASHDSGNANVIHKKPKNAFEMIKHALSIINIKIQEVYMSRNK